MIKYKRLINQIFISDCYKIVPIRFKDRINIMNWRNEQMYHLRQNKQLTLNEQNSYFKNTISSIFDDYNPNQILFSYLKNEECIGYGGLVHINWVDKNAEISFIMNTKLEKECFEFHWSKFLFLIEIVAFQELNLYKIFTYAFDVRPNLYKVLENSSYLNEAVLKEHCYFDDKYIDVVIHSKKNQNYLYFRKANMGDLSTYYKWLNDVEVRSQSYNSNIVNFESHKNWFELKVNDKMCFLLIFQNKEKKNIGQVRIQKKSDKDALIGVSVDEKYRGKSYATYMLKIAVQYFLSLNPMIIINAYIKLDNLISKTIFEKAGFKFVKIVEYQKFNSYHYINMKK